MTRSAKQTRKQAVKPMFQIIAGTLLAGTLLSGYAANAGPRPDRAAASATEALARGKVDRAISHAEDAVEGAPREAGYRSMLAGAYLKAGRFQSAAQAYDDARALGDNTPRTALSLALARIATGQSDDAIEVLYQSRDDVPAGDLGLALALAGETTQGINMLVDEIRNGNNTPKIRQNLAFAYALSGRWREARVMMGQDVAPAQINDRIGEWARMAKPEAYQQRVASLLGAPMVTDEGFPAELALADLPEAEAPAPAQAVAALEELPPTAAAAVAVEELPAASAAPVAVAVAPVSMARADAVAELPALAPATTSGDMIDGAREIALPPSAVAAAAESNVRLEIAPSVLAAADPVADLPVLERARGFGEMIDGTREIALPPSAIAPSSPSGPPQLEVADAALADNPDQIVFVSQPVVQPIPAATAETQNGRRRSPAYRVRGENTASAAPAAAPVAATPVIAAERASVAPGTHMVQLGAFSSREAARNAWAQAVARNPALGNYRMATSTVDVGGRTLHRVAAAGFDGSRSASSMCGTIRARGASCLVLAAPRDATPGDTRMAAPR